MLWSLMREIFLGFGIWDLEFSYRFSRRFLIHNSDDHPSHGAFFIFDGLPCSQPIGRNYHSLVQRCPMRINRDLRHPLSLSGIIDWLADDQ
jgi:hypothetical protein